MFNTCPRSWYMKYVQKIPGVEDLTYAHRGNVVHHCLEEYYPDKTKPVKEVKQQFEREWKEYKLDESFLKHKKDETWLMVLNGINLDLDVTSTELKIFFPDVVSYLDVVDSKNLRVFDWKSSTRHPRNEESYLFQLKFYSWLYKRKFGVLPSEVGVFYLKYSGSKSELKHAPTDEDVERVEEWHSTTRERMNHYINHPEDLPDFNQDYFFSPYKHLWNLNEKDPDALHSYVLKIRDSYIYVKGKLDEFLQRHLDRKFSYELKQAYFMKKNNPNAKTTIRFWDKARQRLPMGFYKELLKTLDDYAKFKGATPVIEVVDERSLNNEPVTMPDKLMSGLTLRPYQQDAVDAFINNQHCGMLEITTGGGKSLIAAEVTRRLGVKTLFVVDKKELLYQMKETYEKNLGLEVGVIGDGKDDVKPVTVATIQTLNKNLKQYRDYLSTIRLCIMDECHKVASRSYYRLGRALRNCERILGITGTAYRDDGNDMMINATAGYVVYSLKGQTLIDKGYLQRPTIKFVDYKIDESEHERLESLAYKGLINETPDYARFYEQFIKNNVYRNVLVKKIADKHAGDSILIVVKLVEHGKLLEEYIPGSKYVHGSTSSKQRDEFIEQFKNGELKVLISTISIFSEGVDIPSLDVVINAAANKGDVKSIQLLGRVLRKHGGKDAAYYYDFNDAENFFSKASFLRRKAFMSEGHKVSSVSEHEL